MSFVKSIEGGRTLEQIEVAPSGTSVQALELPPLSPSLRVTKDTASLPSNVSQDPSSPSSSSASYKRPLESVVSASGLKNLYVISDETSAQSSNIASRGSTTEATENGNRGSNLVGRTLSGVSASFVF
ncbi:hypothetical protein Leryth_008007 [Lithospermum erythrorhizon]|nr:hypothetical protein Leryth_008007 [Lithospermum erythrorhizon]